MQGFNYVFLKRGEKETIQFELHPSQLAVIDNEQKRFVVPGEIEVFVGGSQPSVRFPVASAMKKGVLKITGENFEVE